MNRFAGATLERAAERVRGLLAGYETPDFAHVPTADAALFLSAIDHKSGYADAHAVGGRGPFAGSELLWELACAAERERPGSLSAAALHDVTAEALAELLRADQETVAGAGERARLWREIAAGLIRDHQGSTDALLAASGERLGGEGGLIARLAGFEAYSDPLRKKAFLFAKIVARRGWFAVSDPDAWEVCADNVLMRIALRSGLVQEGPLDRVREETMVALRELAVRAGTTPPVLDDLLWERGREDPDLLGNAAGEIREPERLPGRHWY